MLDGLKPYPEYKDAREAWLSAIPAHWETRRNGRLFAHRVETGFPDLPVLEVSIKTGVRIRNLDSAARKQVMSDFGKYKRTCQGDIAYNMMRMWQGAVGVSPVDGLVSPAYVVARPHAGTNTRFFDYLFRTPAYMDEVNNFSRGIVSDRNRLYWDEFKQMPSPFPPPAEQAGIVRFLGAVDRKVNRFIRAKRRLIEVLTEQKQAIITHAVTKGLNPHAPLKPSGIDWLGDVPEHWEVVPLRRRCAVIDCKHVTVEFVEDGFPLASVREVQTFDLSLGNANRTTSDWYEKLIEGDIELARLVLQSCGLDLPHGPIQAKSFVINMNIVFERFVHRALADALRPSDLVLQHGASEFYLDRERFHLLNPDLSVCDAADRGDAHSILYDLVLKEQSAVDRPRRVHLLSRAIMHASRYEEHRDTCEALRASFADPDTLALACAFQSFHHTIAIPDPKKALALLLEGRRYARRARSPVTRVRFSHYHVHFWSKGPQYNDVRLRGPLPPSKSPSP